MSDDNKQPVFEHIEVVTANADIEDKELAIAIARGEEEEYLAKKASTIKDSED